MAYYNEYDQLVETDEERRKRLQAEQEQAQAQDQENGYSQSAMGSGTAYSDIPGLLYDKKMSDLQNRYAGVTQMFEDPAGAIRQRIQQGSAPDDAANTEVQSETVKTYGDGSQEQIIKTQTPAPQPAPQMQMAPAPMPAAQAQPGPQMSPAQMSQAPGAPVSPQQTTDPVEIQRRQEAMRAMVARQAGMAPPAAATPAPAQATAPTAAQPAAQLAVQPVAPAAMPGANLSQIAQAGNIPAAIDPNAAMPDIGAPPVPGPGVQVASTVPGAGVAEAAAAQAAQTARPQWAIDLEAAGTDEDKLVDIAANKAYPKDVRDDAKAKLRIAQDNAIAAKDAEKTVTAAAQGDPVAQQKLLNSIKPATIKKEEGKATEGKATEGSYIRAYLYARLGLNELAKEEQEKIMGRTEYGQVSLDNAKYEVTKDKKTGQITSARDKEGNRVDTPILNRIRAESLKISTATPPSAGAQRIRDSEGTEFSVVPTPQGSVFYNNKGEKGVPVGRTVPIAVGSDLEIAQAKEDINTVAGFSRQTAAARLKAFENTNAKRADRLLPLLSLEGMGLRPDGSLLSEDVRRPGAPTPAATPAPAPAAAATTPAAAPTQRPAPAAAVAPTPVAPAATTTTPLVSTAGPTAGGGGSVRTSAGGIPTAEAMERQSKEGDLERSTREAQIKDRNKANQDYSDALAASRQSAAAQGSTITRLQSSIDRNPEFWGIDTNSGVWRAYVDLNSTNADKAESLNTLARNLNIPKAKRAQFDQTMNDYRNLQVNAVTGSGLTASQTNTERESQRVMGTIGAISDRPAAAKATLEYAKAKIDYTDAKARAWADARRTNPGIDRLAFEANFDATKGEQIFKDVNERMAKILGQTPGGGAQTSGATKTINGVTYVYDGRGWKPQ